MTLSRRPVTFAQLAPAALFAVTVMAAYEPAWGQASFAERIAESAKEIRPDMDRLPALDQAIGDARIVFLGEPWHGDGAAIAERGWLVRYLHEHHDFDVLVFEGDFYALHRGWENALRTGRASAMAAENLYPFWSRTEAAKPLWTYIDAQLAGADPLIVAGVDTKVVGEETKARLPEELRLQLLGLKGVDEAAAANASATLRKLLAPQKVDAGVSDADFADLVRLVDRLATSLREAPDADPFWVQNAQSMRRMLTSESRDIGMAENLIWIAARLYPGKRIIVWTHNNHALVDKWALYDSRAPEALAVFGGEDAESVGRRTYFGEATRHYFGRDAVYSIAAVSHEGRYSSNIQPALYGEPANFDAAAVLAPAPAGSIEAVLARAGHETAFINLRPFRGDDDLVASRALDYSQLPALPLRLQTGFDGLLFIRRTYGLNETP